MFLGVVSTIDKNLSKQNLNKNDEKTIHLCDRANELTTIVLKNADNLSFGDLVLLDINDNNYNFKKIEFSSSFDQNLLIQFYNLIVAEKEKLKEDEIIFKQNFGDFGQLGKEIFYCFSNRNRLIEKLNNKFHEILSNLKNDSVDDKLYPQIQCLKIFSELQVSKIDLIHWIKYSLSILHLLDNEYIIDKELLINIIESLLNTNICELDKDGLKIQIDQQLKEKWNELKGQQKKLV